MEEYDWYCDECGTYLNDQSGFTSSSGSWRCSKCGYVNDVTENNVIPDEGSKGYVVEIEHEDGLSEKIRFTKTREVHDLEKDGRRISVWSRRNK